MASSRSVLILAVGGIAALVIALSAHAIMFERLHLPPPSLPSGGWAVLPDRMMRVLGLVWVFRMLPERIQRSPLRAAATLSLIVLVVNENLLRIPLMEVINNTNLTLYPFLDVAPTYLIATLLACGIVVARPYLKSTAGSMVVAATLACLVYLLVAPILEDRFAPIRVWTALREGQSFYNPPYDWHILVPAYLTFAEAVVGAFLVAVKTTGSLPGSGIKAWAVLSVMIFALRGVFFSCLTSIPYAKTTAATAF